ncbi:hypothetical protein ACOSQ2_004788 [Xanthoceras sorbifolium]
MYTDLEIGRHSEKIRSKSMKVMVKFIKFHSTYGGEDNVFIFLGKYQSHGYVI